MRIIKESDHNAGAIVAQYLQEGKIILIATDTIYGLGVDATNAKAVANLYKLKQRNENKAISILLKNLESAQKLFIFSELALKIAHKFLPGALTMVLQLANDQTRLANNLNINGNNIGFRIIDRDFINKIFENFDGEIALTSANISGNEVIKNIDEVEKIFCKTDLDLLVVDGGELENRLPSSVINFIDGKVNILRPGLISREELQEL